MPQDEKAENIALMEKLDRNGARRGDKAPGPDGFSINFFKRGWEIIKYDLVVAMQNFLVQGFFEKRSFNVTFVALILKKTRAIGLNDYRPISLIGGVSKIIARLLVGRL